MDSQAKQGMEVLFAEISKLRAVNAALVAALEVLVAGSTMPANGVTRAPRWTAIERAEAALRAARGES